MDRLTATLAFVVISLTSVYGQPALTKSCNGFRDGDSLVMRLVYGVVPGASGHNAVWDYSDAESGNTHTLQYKTAGNGFSAIDGGTSWRTEVRGDTILLTGFENRHTLMDYDTPLPLLRYPFSYGDSILGSFHGTGKWCDRMFMRVWGRGVTRADGEGTLILPSGDTLRNVLRVHSLRRTWHSCLDTIRTWAALREAVRQEAERNPDPDTIRMAPVTSDSYAWYAPGWRYPVLRMEHASDGLGSAALAVLFPPDSQSELEYDRENAPVRLRGFTQGGTVTSENGHFEPGCHMVSHSTSLDDSTGKVTVEFTLSHPAAVSLQLSDVAGVSWQTMSRSYGTAGTYTMSISCSGLPHGQYALRMTCGADVYTEKFNVR